MGKSELLADVVSKSKVQVDEKKADAVINAVLESIKGSLLKGEKVTLQGFGTFETVNVAEAQRRNPRTGEKFMAPAHKSPKFKFSGSFKSLF